MDLLQQRLEQIDSFLDSATVPMADLTDIERKLANELCNYVELPLGTLLRRADAIPLAGGRDNFSGNTFESVATPAHADLGQPSTGYNRTPQSCAY